VSSTSVVGLQWGDEAKGKLVDLLAPQFDIVVRYLGGANAGHTVVSGDRTFKLHHIPSGILHPGVINVVAPGVVIDPGKILEEIELLEKRGISIQPDRLLLSERSHLVCPWHLAEDRLSSRNDVEGEPIGTTLRGIGPCYKDKVGRTYAIRLGDLCRADLAERVQRVYEAKQAWLAFHGAKLTQDDREIFAEFSRTGERLRPFITDTTDYLLEAVEAGRRLLFEGAQGALLDIDHGTYPFVTSTNSSGVGTASGSGVPARWIGRVIGVMKAYSTRVGGGPFPTELTNELGQRIRERGKEYGTTTGRPRRCGWFDAVAVRYTARLSGVNELSAMMLDVLSGFETIPLCVAYDIDGERTVRFPADVDQLRRVKPVWRNMPGWHEELDAVRHWQDLPVNARAYLDTIADLIGVPITIVSVGPDREHTIYRS
jgi:adenylosuccinate synthase